MSGLWATRARRFGRRSVVGVPLADEELDAVTEQQAAVLIPLLRAELPTAPVGAALDYGCGYGRFGPHLSAFASHLTGFDPCGDLFHHRPPSAMSLTTGNPDEFLQASKETYDLIWVVHVLGGIGDAGLSAAAHDLVGALASGGLLFIADNTWPFTTPAGFWAFRTERRYCATFADAGVDLRVVGHYTALDNPMSVFAGRKA